VVINGQKTFISNGLNCGLVMVAAQEILPSKTPIRPSISIWWRTGTPGFERGKRIKKVGWHSQDTAELFFSDCRIPKEQPPGAEGRRVHDAHGEASAGTAHVLHHRGGRCRTDAGDDHSVLPGTDRLSAVPSPNSRIRNSRLLRWPPRSGWAAPSRTSSSSITWKGPMWWSMSPWASTGPRKWPCAWPISVSNSTEVTGIARNTPLPGPGGTPGSSPSSPEPARS
jgi:hypothetical protein